jgi:hypothetical protein
MAEIRRQAEELAQKRREAREDVATWVTIDVSEYDKKPSGRGGGGGGGGGKRKKKDADLSEDEGSGRASGGSDGEGSEEEERRPKKKSKSKSKKKAKKYADPDEEGASEMDVDGEEKKKVSGFLLPLCSLGRSTCATEADPRCVLPLWFYQPKAKPRKKKAVAVEGSDEEGAEPVIKKGPKKGNKKLCVVSLSSLSSSCGTQLTCYSPLFSVSRKRRLVTLTRKLDRSASLIVPRRYLLAFACPLLSVVSYSRSICIHHKHRTFARYSKIWEI